MRLFSLADIIPATASTELYNFESNTWSTGPELPTALARMGVATSDDRDSLVLVGGVLPDGDASDMIFEYSGSSHTWFVWPGTMESGRINPTAVLVGQEADTEVGSAAGGYSLAILEKKSAKFNIAIILCEIHSGLSPNEN